MLAKDAQIIKAEAQIGAALNTPFQFDLTLPPSGVPTSQVWHLSRWSLEFFAPSNIVNLDVNCVIAQLIPISSVQAPTTTGPQLPINSNLFGVELNQLGTDLSNNGPNTWGFQSIFFDAPIDIPPGWALRVTILDNAQVAQPVLPAGTLVRISAFLEAFPIDFADPVKYP